MRFVWSILYTEQTVHVDNLNNQFYSLWTGGESSLESGDSRLSVGKHTNQGHAVILLAGQLKRVHCADKLAAIGL